MIQKPKLLFRKSSFWEKYQKNENPYTSIPVLVEQREGFLGPTSPVFVSLSNSLIFSLIPQYFSLIYHQITLETWYDQVTWSWGKCSNNLMQIKKRNWRTNLVLQRNLRTLLANLLNSSKNGGEIRWRELAGEEKKQ